ncbi:MAG: leucine-rich repeat protein [Oscillospiraceae bacterium]|nr:leucine-rich repeat protein [Oscillospiraceae bacterium]
MKRRALSLLLALAFLGLLWTPALAAEGDFIISGKVLVGYKGTMDGIIIPDGVESIGNLAFYNCASIMEVVIPEGVKSIGDYAFAGCTNLSSIQLPASLVSISDYAFSGCTKLQYVLGGQGVTSMGTGVFFGCSSLGYFTVPRGITALPVNTFRSCTRLEGVGLPAALQSIGAGAFQGCARLFDLELPSSLRTVGDSAFRGCTGLRELELPRNLTTLGNDVFRDCTGLSELSLPGILGVLPSGVFAGCTGLRTLKLENGIYSIRDRAFSGCTNLRSATLPVTVTSISATAFEGCSRLTVFAPDSSAAHTYAVNLGINYEESDGVAVSFRDIEVGKYYYASCYWALEKGITVGTSAVTFSPNATCTRAQILTFLYRAAGEPVIDIQSPFTDIAQRAYYYPAALWAYALGMVEGGTFQPSKPCTRAETVTYMWIFAEKPQAPLSYFEDLNGTSAAVQQAVGWALANGVTSGITARAFAPDRTCTRGEIVTFLYRAFA